MSHREHNDVNEARRLETFNRHRGRVFSVAYGMLGQVADAEDAVQDAYLRWQGLTDEQLEKVRSPENYLAAVIMRLSLDRLRSARARREEYVGPWLPEPLLTEPVETEAVAEEALSVAVMVLLDSLTPVERAVFLLREVFGYGYDEISLIVGKSETNCRQIARRAKASVAARRPRFEPSREEQEHLLRSFVEAASEGNMEGLLSLLAEDVAFYSDGGGKVTAARNPVHGRDRVTRLILGILDKRRRRPGFGVPLPFSVRRVRINGRPGLAGYVGALPVGALTLEVAEASAGASIRGIYMVLNPEKLSKVPRLPKKIQKTTILPKRRKRNSDSPCTGKRGSDRTQRGDGGGFSSAWCIMGATYFDHTSASDRDATLDQGMGSKIVVLKKTTGRTGAAIVTDEYGRPGAVLVRAADAEVLADGPNSSITLLADADATGGALTSNRATLRRGSDGAPPHYHTRAAELFFVLGGCLRVLVGERVLTLEEGDFLVVPPYVPHAFAPAPGADADALIVFSPGMARFDYYRLLDRVYRGEASPREIPDSQERFDNHYVDSPAWRQARDGG